MSDAAAVAAAPIPEWTFGDRLRKAREHAGLDQAAMAATLEVSSGSISNWETGRGLPRGGEVRLAQRWEEVTGVSAAWLLGVQMTSARKLRDTRQLHLDLAWSQPEIDRRFRHLTDSPLLVLVPDLATESDV